MSRTKRDVHASIVIVVRLITVRTVPPAVAELRGSAAGGSRGSRRGLSERRRHERWLVTRATHVCDATGSG